MTHAFPSTTPAPAASVREIAAMSVAIGFIAPTKTCNPANTHSISHNETRIAPKIAATIQRNATISSRKHSIAPAISRTAHLETAHLAGETASPLRENLSGSAKSASSRAKSASSRAESASSVGKPLSQSHLPRLILPTASQPQTTTPENS